MSLHQLQVQDESLISEESHNNLLRRKLGKARTFVKPIDRPSFAFAATCHGVPQDISAGTHLQFEIAIEPLLHSSTSEIEPEVTLDGCTVTLTAQTSGPHPAHIEVLRQRQRTQRPAGPFSKDHEYRKTVDFGVLGHVPSAFNFADVSRSYKLRIAVQFYAADNTVVMTREYPAVFRPLGAVVNGFAAGEGLKGTSSVSDGLPTYDEAMAW